MIKKILILIITFTACFKGFSQDDPCTALPLPLSPIGSCNYVMGDNTGATDSANGNIDVPTGCEPVSANYNGADVWFYIDLGPTTTSINIDITHIATSNFDDAVAALYTGTCGGNLTILECDDDSGSGFLEANFSAFGLTPGTRVFIRVWEWGGFDEGTFNICASEVVDPCNSITTINDCGPTPINTSINTGFGAINDAACFDVPGDEVIFEFTPTVTGNYTITQISTYVTSSVSNHINYLYQTSCSPTGWTCIADLFGNNQTSGSFSMVAGTTYYIMLDSENSNGGNVSFTLNCPLPPPECGDDFYDSGGLAGNYSNNEFETTLITPTNAGDVVTVTFTAFETEGFFDELTVYDGPNNTFPVLGVFSGNGIPGPFTSSDASGALYFEFDSDGSITDPGWEATITCAAPVCGSTVYDSGGSGGDYAANELYTITYTPEIAGDILTATFTAFDTESGFDTLSVYDGPTTGSPLLGTFSGTGIPGPFTSTNPAGELTFEFTSNGSNESSGWAADLTCSTPICGNLFYDSGGPGGNYFPNELTTTTLTPDIPGTAVVVTFNTFNLESCCDELLVYDGPDATYPLLGTFTGTALPGPFTSTDPSGALTFVFDSDFSVQLSGWEADITCVSNCNVTIADTNYPIGASNCTLDYTELVATTGGATSTRSTIYSENFDGAGFPAGWSTVNGGASADWIISPTTNAGGTANEAMLDWISGSQTSTWTLTSAAINIAGSTGLELDFSQDLDIFLSGIGLGIYVEVSTDDITYTTEYSAVDPPNDFSSSENIDLSAYDGNPSLYIRFRLTGNTSALLNWSIDNVSISADGAPIIPQISWSPATGLYTDNTLTTPYVLGNYAGTVYANPASTTTYTATENPSMCTETVVVTRGGNTWLGGTTDWNTPSNWSFGTVPTKTDEVIIPNLGAGANYPILFTGIPIPPAVSRAGCLTIGYNAFVEIKNNGRLVVTDGITINEGATFPDVDGKLLIRSGGNLIQITDGAVNTNNNSGSIKMQRSVTGVAADSYIYWSSPVEGFDVSDVSPSTTGYIFEWNPTTSVAIPYGNWISPSPTIMSQGKGYIIRDLIGTTPEDGTMPPYTPPIATTAEFIGIPRNGELTTTISRGNHLPAAGDYAGAGNTMATPNDDNWNLVGNPYPSSISADAFITENAGVIEVESGPPIFGTIWLWVHQNTTSLINDPFYDDYVYNYDSNQYTAYNLTGSNPAGWPGEIASGQGFFVLMQDIPGPTISADVTFRNSMRYFLISGDEIEYNNNSFLRTSSDDINTTNEIERHRIWLDLIKQNGNATSILVGYIEGATNANDDLFDGPDLNRIGTRLYSLIDNNEYSIQGKTLPFDQEDTVPLGITITENGIYQIAINSLDGLFESESQAIYLEDTYNNTIHDLRSATYSFASEIGTFDDRFILRYTNQTLGVKPIDVENGISIITPQSEYVKVNSEIGVIDTVQIYDILGRVIFNNSDINSSEFIYKETNLSDGAYIVKVVLVNGQQKIQKVVLKQ